MIEFEFKFEFGSVRFGSVRFGSVRFGSVRFGSVRFGSVRFGSVRFGFILSFLVFVFVRESPSKAGTQQVLKDSSTGFLRQEADITGP